MFPRLYLNGPFSGLTEQAFLEYFQALVEPVHPHRTSQARQGLDGIAIELETRLVAENGILDIALLREHTLQCKRTGMQL